ncbi:MAG: DUF3820 family protein [Bacteroidota bacterium]
MTPDPNFLIELANYKMPFGKYKSTYLIDLPEYYLVWYRNKGFPKGKLGQMMETVFEIKRNGLEHFIYKLKI